MNNLNLNDQYGALVYDNGELVHLGTERTGQFRLCPMNSRQCFVHLFKAICFGMKCQKSNLVKVKKVFCTRFRQ